MTAVATSVPSRVPHGVIAVIRTTSAEAALVLARGFSRSGVSAIEVTMTVPDAPDVIRTMVAERCCAIGAGTVTTLEQLHRCVDAGAEFIVSPHTDAALVRESISRGAMAVPGAMTPTEIVAAIGLGASAVKVFPAAAVGGLEFLRAVRRPIPDCALVMSGGIPVGEVSSYLSAGARAVCLETGLRRVEDVVALDVEAVREYATAVVEQCGGPWN